MSYLKQRKNKICLNCNATLDGRYCSICGQENIEPKESVSHLVGHFFKDITHFDGKFFSSLKYIITKPGFLSKEYFAGRRNNYLNPVRFYVFTSALFFFIMFSFFYKKANPIIQENNKVNGLQDTAAFIKRAKKDGLNSIAIQNIIANSKMDSFKIARDKGFTIFHIYDYSNRKQFDSLDKLKKVKQGFFGRRIIEKQFQLQENYEGDRDKTNEVLKENFIHSIPQVLIFSLPFFALLLKLLYIRKKNYYYVSHIIFTIHFYIFVYIQILLINIFSKIAGYTKQGWIYDFTILLGFGIIFYMYKAMRYFYEQSRAKTIFKLLILFLLVIILFLIFLIILFGISIFKM